MIRIYLIVILLLLINQGKAIADQAFPDSLKALIFADKSSRVEKSKAATVLAEYLLSIRSDSAAYYAAMALELSKQSDYLPGFFDNSCTLGKIMLRKDSIDKAVSIFENAREKVQLLEDKSNALCVLLLLGYAYDSRKEYLHAHEAYYEGLRIAEEAKDSAFLWSYYNNLGAHYMEILDYPKSIEMLRKGLQIYSRLKPDQKKHSLASTYNNMAVTFQDMDEPDSALRYIQLALKEPDLKGNHYGLFNLFGNLGRAYLRKNDPEKALQEFTRAGLMLDSLKGNFKGSITPLYASHYRYVGNTYFAMGDLKTARDYFLEALNFSKASSELNAEAEVLEKLSAIYESSGDYKLSLSYHKDYVKVKETLEMNRADEKIAQVTLEYQFEQTLQTREHEMEITTLKHRRRELIYLFTIFTSIGILVSLFLLYRLQRNKARRKHLEERAVRLEKEMISEELDYKNKELTTNVLYLLKKNEFISSISMKLSEILIKLKEEDAKSLKSIITELDKTAEDSTWDEFELRFKDVHTDFYNRLGKQYPGLTAQELRLCAFLRLNMTNKEISAITYQSTESLKTARYRLRKKNWN